MDPAELKVYLTALRDQASRSAPDAANAMARAMQNRVWSLLREHSHRPGMFYRAQAGARPSFVTGNLSNSIIRTPAHGSIRASASVGATAVYAAIQEFGGETWGNRGYMRWKNSAG